jgi:hypothetical protein
VVYSLARLLCSTYLRMAASNASNSLLKKASDPVVAGAVRDFSYPKANKKTDSISHLYPE